MPVIPCRGERRVLPLLERVELVEEARGREAERRAGLARRPHFDEPVQRVLALLDAELVTHRARHGLLRAAEAPTLVADDRLDRAEELRRGHDADRHARPAEHRLDHLGVIEVRDDDAVLHRVPADDPARRNTQAEDRIARGRQLVDELLRGRPPVVRPGIGLLEDDETGGLDARVAGVDRGGDEVREPHVRDEPAALLDLEHRLLPLLPLRDAHLPGEHAGIDADVGDGLGERERGAPGPAILAGLRWRGERHVVAHLLRRAALVDRRQPQEPGERARRGARVDPGELERGEREGEVLRPRDEAALLRIHERRGDAGRVVVGEELVLALGPLVFVPPTLRHEPRDRAARDAARRLNQHLQVVPFREAPHELSDVVAGERLERLGVGLQGRRRHWELLGGGGGEVRGGAHRPGCSGPDVRGCAADSSRGTGADCNSTHPIRAGLVNRLLGITPAATLCRARRIAAWRDELAHAIG